MLCASKSYIYGPNLFPIASAEFIAFWNNAYLSKKKTYKCNGAQGDFAINSAFLGIMNSFIVSKRQSLG